MDWSALSILIVGVVYLALALRVYREAVELRVVHCPATGGAAAVRVEAARSALRLGLHGGARVTQCSLWPSRRHCAQTCLAEVSESEEGCRFRRVLAHWYAGKRCTFCRRAIAPVRWGELRPALLSPQGRLVSWAEIAPLSVFEVLRTHAPVCASCDVAETFRRRYPDRVVERAPRPQAPLAH
jgi:hypothetical protein